MRELVSQKPLLATGGLRRAASYPNGPHAALRRGLTARATNLGTRTYAHRMRDQTQGRERNREPGR